MMLSPWMDNNCLDFILVHLTENTINVIFNVTGHKTNFFWYLAFKAGYLQFLPCHSTLTNYHMPVGMLLKNSLSSAGTIQSGR